MARTIVHTADLHLAGGEDRAYGFTVLDEILSVCQSGAAEALLISGDLFDSFEAAHAVHRDLRDRLARLPRGVRVFFVPGNHEELGRSGDESLAALDLGRAEVLSALPFSLVGMDAWELLAIPHQPDYASYLSWKVPAKAAPVRIAMAHASVADLKVYLGPGQDEEGAGFAVSDLFARFGVDFAALGHIHRPVLESRGLLQLAYPGSPRVWRRGELGVRGVNLLRLDDGVRCERIQLKSAGEYRLIEAAVGLDGAAPELTAEERCWGPGDFVEIRLKGLVEDENAFAGLERRLRSTYGRAVRRLEVVNELEAAAGISVQPLALRFLQEMDLRKPAPGNSPEEEARLRVWRKARELGLRAVSQSMKGGRR